MKVLSCADTSYLLRRNLGTTRAWGDFLSDCARGRTTFEGLELLPITHLTERCPRPVYDPREIAQFIRDVIRLVPPKATAADIEPFEISIDPASLRLPRKMRRAVRCKPKTTK
ncbi:MAG: hypothetical protein H7293_10700 [Candidatus Saccharibacteria bacterium]|nr:hypothetical protein [Rhodoferax sp.]